MIFILILSFAISEVTSNFTATPQPQVNVTEKANKTVFVRTRRILRGSEAGDTRPYMVYLRSAEALDAMGGRQGSQKDAFWLCGGVIIHRLYVLTSAACIEDIKNFYVIAGTHSWSEKPSECVTNGKKKAIWKCTMQGYNFDGADFENIQWMESDIAVVKVDSAFNCNKRVKGCDFVPQVVRYNNESIKLERPGTKASIAGWGSTGAYQDASNYDPDDMAAVQRSISRYADNSPELLEADVVVMKKDKCIKLWPERYHPIIEASMICTKDVAGGTGGTDCSDQGVKCVDMTNNAEYEELYEDDDDVLRSKGSLPMNRKSMQPPNLGNSTKRVHHVHTYMHHKDLRRVSQLSLGGFCENDHGGPLINGHGRTSMVIGIVSACQTKPGTLECHGPFLYTSLQILAGEKVTTKAFSEKRSLSGLKNRKSPVVTCDNHNSEEKQVRKNERHRKSCRKNVNKVFELNVHGTLIVTLLIFTISTAFALRFISTRIVSFYKTG